MCVQVQSYDLTGIRDTVGYLTSGVLQCMNAGSLEQQARKARRGHYTFSERAAGTHGALPDELMSQLSTHESGLASRSAWVMF